MQKEKLHFLDDIDVDNINKTNQYCLLGAIKKGLSKYLDSVNEVSPAEKEVVITSLREAQEIELKFPMLFPIPGNALKKYYYEAVLQVKELLLNMEENLSYMEKNGFKDSLHGFWDEYSLWETAEDRLKTFYNVKDEDES
jgi:hypothetical protein